MPGLKEGAHCVCLPPFVWGSLKEQGVEGAFWEKGASYTSFLPPLLFYLFIGSVFCPPSLLPLSSLINATVAFRSPPQYKACFRDGEREGCERWMKRKRLLFNLRFWKAEEERSRCAKARAPFSSFSSFLLFSLFSLFVKGMVVSSAYLYVLFRKPPKNIWEKEPKRESERGKWWYINIQSMFQHVSFNPFLLPIVSSNRFTESRCVCISVCVCVCVCMCVCVVWRLAEGVAWEGGSRGLSLHSTRKKGKIESLCSVYGSITGPELEHCSLCDELTNDHTEQQHLFNTLSGVGTPHSVCVCVCVCAHTWVCFWSGHF